MQAFDALVGELDHVLAVAELQGLRLASRDAGRGHALGDAVDAARALVDDGALEHPGGVGCLVVTGHVERARHGAVPAADALALVDRDHAVLGLEDGASRADLGAGRVGTVLAGATTEGPLDALGATLLLIEGHDEASVAVEVDGVLVRAAPLVGTIEGRGKVVPALAGNLATLARGAARSVKQNRFLAHVVQPP